MSKLRWQDMASLLIGVWVAASPWVLGITEEAPLAMWSAGAAGVLIALLAAIDLETPAAWEEWAMGALGIWLVISPWILGYAAHRTMTVSSIAAGAVVMALAGWTLYAAHGGSRRHGAAH